MINRVHGMKNAPFAVFSLRNCEQAVNQSNLKIQPVMKQAIRYPVL